jgi:ectoine hydroxylase-related dioxygenase (phytanoyl-CoA dioxygenase family)
MTPEYGSTEIWPGTHRDTSVSIFDETIKVSEEKLNQRRAIAPPIQPHVKRGGIVIRDIRLWHAGMPNRTQQPRPMIATIHTIHWLSEGARLKFPKGTETFFQESNLTTLAEFVDGPIDYIRAPKAYDYQK